MTVTVTAASNRAPTAAPDNAIVEIGQTVSVPVLANDSDPDGDSLSLVSVTNGSYGVAAVAGQDVSYSSSVGFVEAMRRNGWSWGARWAHPDYQHFSSNGAWATLMINTSILSRCCNDPLNPTC